MVCKCLNGNETFDSRWVFNLAEKSIMSSSISRLELGKGRLEIRCIFFRVKGINYWYNLARSGLDSSIICSHCKESRHSIA